jgi:hypothetical protein
VGTGSPVQSCVPVKWKVTYPQQNNPLHTNPQVCQIHSQHYILLAQRPSFQFLWYSPPGLYLSGLLYLGDVLGWVLYLGFFGAG